VVLVLAAFIGLWVTAPQWEAPLGLNHPGSTPQVYVYLNLTLWQFSGPSSCWAGSVFSIGGTVPLNGTFHASVALPYPGGTTGAACTAETIQVVTTGFSIQTSNVPVTVAPGQSGHLWVNLTAPATPYNGPLTMTVVTASP